MNDLVLDPRREKFAQGVASGLSQAEAYRQANPRASRWKEKTVMNRASEWANDREISGRIAQLRRETARAAAWTREDSVRVLSRIAQDPDKDSAGVAAVKELNAMLGFNEPQRVDLTNSDGSLAPRAIFINAVKVQK